LILLGDHGQVRDYGFRRPRGHGQVRTHAVRGSDQVVDSGGTMDSVGQEAHGTVRNYEVRWSGRSWRYEVLCMDSVGQIRSVEELWIPSEMKVIDR
jgi:hypothetical protein